MNTTPPTAPVLVVGATGNLGGQVVDALLDIGKPVRALVRPTTDAGKLESLGVEIARGDMLDVDSLVTAMTGADAVITTAAGYTRGGKNADDIDTIGNANLAEAAHRSGIRKFVLTSILTSDRTPDVPHFWHKKLAEDRLESLGVPFVALRPGAFLDQIATMGGDPISKGRFLWVGNANTPLTFVLIADLARYLAAAVDADTEVGERIDVGWDRPVGAREAALLLSDATGQDISVRAIPAPLVRAAGTVTSRFVPIIKDMAAMFSWFDTGNYVADITRQTELFGPAPTAEDATLRLGHRLASSSGH
ncbi:SDR family oxidoreductase [Rhodococcus sp. BP-316]|uniref:SDR family oxidoreductase n=1 Tax=Rhodococcus sp. BP-316 TaxID=2739445 RepID=UPI001C9AFDCB|nr:SDR family oxidoreductase [Rhodococcus sp. BP-316]MBY6683035.1 SDR family oxidoreductase [Rhodococcus sp. BP-316]